MENNWFDPLAPWLRTTSKPMSQSADKDFALRVKIARKEAKESRLWLRLCEVGEERASEDDRQKLIAEAVELGKIFGSILAKTK